MLKYLVRRLASSVVTVWIISMVCFTIINLPSGDIANDYEYRLIANRGYRPDAARVEGNALRVSYGLDKPLPVQYVNWLSRFLRGDFGISLVTFHPVSRLIWERLAYTLMFAGLSLVVAWVVGITIGIYSATHQYSIVDYLATLVAFVGLSIPDFVFALVLLAFTVFVLRGGVPTGLFSPGFDTAPWGWPKFKDLLQHLWIPVLVGGLPGAAGLLRIMRANLLDILGSQYVETARAKGLPEHTVILKHAVRVAINPLISLLGVQFPRLISAGVVVSIVLGLPTVGPLLFDSLTTQDIYVSATILMLLGALLVVGNLAADLLLAWVDPRIRLT